MVDHKGGAISGDYPCLDFGRWFTKCNMLDLGYQGLKFTWYRGDLMQRLDRAFANNSWLEAFGNSIVLNLPRVYSNHRPILIKNLNQMRPKRRGSFKFLLPWVTHEKFKKVVKNSWR